GIVKWKRGDADGAVDALERAGDPEALVALAEVHRSRGQMDAALDALRRALSEAPEGPIGAEIYRGLGELHFASGRYDRAVGELGRAAAPADSAETHALLGESWFRLGERDKALAALRRALSLDASSATPAGYVTLGECALAQGEREEAERAFRAAGSTPAALVGLGRVALDRGDLMTAHDQALRALGADAKSALAQRLLADAHERAGNLEAAFQIRERLGEQPPDDPLAQA